MDRSLEFSSNPNYHWPYGSIRPRKNTRREKKKGWPGQQRGVSREGCGVSYLGRQLGKIGLRQFILEKIQTHPLLKLGLDLESGEWEMGVGCRLWRGEVGLTGCGGWVGVGGISRRIRWWRLGEHSARVSDWVWGELEMNPISCKGESVTPEPRTHIYDFWYLLFWICKTYDHQTLYRKSAFYIVFT